MACHSSFSEGSLVITRPAVMQALLNEISEQVPGPVGLFTHIMDCREGETSLNISFFSMVGALTLSRKLLINLCVSDVILAHVTFVTARYCIPVARSVFSTTPA